MFPKKEGISRYYSPHVLLGKRQIDFKKVDKSARCRTKLALMLDILEARDCARSHPNLEECGVYIDDETCDGDEDCILLYDEYREIGSASVIEISDDDSDVECLN